MKTKFVQKNMKTEISGQKKFTCVHGKIVKKFRLASKLVNIFRAQNMKFIIKIW